MFKTAKLLLTIGFFFACHINSCAQAVGDTTIENALLWEISGNGLRSSSYLYGTIHVICKSDAVISESVKEKILASKILFLESVYSNYKRDTIDYSLTKGKPLYKLIGRQYFKQLKSILSKYLISDDSLNTIKPFLIELMVENTLLDCRTTSYDNEIQKIATENKLTIKGLETISEHFAPVDKIPINQQAETLVNQLKFYNSRKHDLEGDILLYQQQNINTIYTLAAYFHGERVKKSILFLDDRNKLWLQKIDNAIKENSCFFAFGCAHLAGASGIVSLLRHMGYILTPIY